MEKEEQILREYEDADLNERLYLFLRYPDLREAFQVIEISQLSSESGLAPQQRARKRRCYRKYGDCLRGLLNFFSRIG